MTEHQLRFISDGIRNRCVFLTAFPGAGKGTATSFLKEHMANLQHLSTGELFRAEAATGSHIGKQFSEHMNAGRVIPHELVAEYLSAELSKEKYGGGVVIDGFPKNKISYDYIMETLPQKNIEPFLAVHIDVPREVCAQRLASRMLCQNSGCGADWNLETKKPKVAGKCDKCGSDIKPRADDTPAAIQKRLDVFEETTMPNLERFRQAGILVRIDGTKSIAEVQAQLVAVLVDKIRSRHCELIRQGLRHRCVTVAGPISCGKGTQCAAVRTLLENSVEHTSTGTLFRAEVAKGSEIGKKFDTYMRAGQLVPQQLIDSFLDAEFSDSNKYSRGVLLDGYFREVPALDYLMRMLPTKQLDLFLALHIDVPNDVILKRVGGRRSCPKGDCGASYHVDFKKPKVDGKCDKCNSDLVVRDDDKPAAIQKRIAVFGEQTLPALEKFQKHYGGVVIKVDGSASIDDVTLQCVAALAQRITQQRQTGNFFCRPPKETNRSATFHGHIDCKNTSMLCSIINDIEERNSDWQHKVYPISHLCLCTQTTGKEYGAIYKCLPNFHGIKDAREEAFATSRHGAQGFDYDLIRTTLETCWGDKYGKDGNGVMTELEQEIFVGNFEGNKPSDGNKVEVELDTMAAAATASFDWIKLGGGNKEVGEMWRKRMLSHVPRWELHHAINIEKKEEEEDGCRLPIPLEKIREFAEANDMPFGGIFNFCKRNFTALRTNEFSDLPTVEAAHARLLKQAKALLAWVLAEQKKPENSWWKDRKVTSGFSIEIVWAIWHVDEKLKTETEVAKRVPLVDATDFIGVAALGAVLALGLSRYFSKKQ